MSKRAGQKLKKSGSTLPSNVEQKTSTTATSQPEAKPKTAAPPLTQKEYNAAGFTGSYNYKDLGERAINGYTGQDYASTNAILGGYYTEKYGQKPNAKQKKQAMLQEKILNNELDRLPSVQAQTFRGLRNAELKSQMINAVGGEIQFKGFQSTSFDQSVAKGFAGRDKKSSVNLVINGKNGKDIQKFSSFKKEKEILFKSSTKFKIDRYDSKTDTFHLTEID